MLRAWKPAKTTTMNPQFPDLQVKPLGRIQRRKGIFFAPLLFCGLLSGQAKAQTAAEILSAVRSSENKIQLRATQIVERGGTREVAQIYRSGLKRRLEWSAPSVKAGDILIDDGETVTLFHRADKTAFQTQSAQRAPVAAGDWKVGAVAQQNGRAVRVLRRGKGRELTIDAKTNLIVRSKGMGGVMTLQNVEFGAVSPAKFVFSAPAGVKITRSDGRLFADLGAAKRFASWLQPPTQLPAGYAFESSIAGKDEVWLRYSNGKKRFSLFQQKTDDADLAPQKVDGGWFWRKNGARFVVTGAPEGAITTLAK